ncbi:ABC transporter substrate-binding protein [Streptomyces sp. NBC_01089]|uniref:ABC transporter substrate-binding protein n=1 Tax=Streptomyces sp. NBC_01089 TaxID=2903747 RepID=UPI00386B100A|nr:ABC transporter substrate-binding protein [Streptomyces sp. NBC_01089]
MRPPAVRTALTAVAAVTALLALTACAKTEAATGASGHRTTVRIPDPGNSGILAKGKKDGSLAKALAKAGATVSWTGSSGPFAPAAQAMNADRLDVALGSITSGTTTLTQQPKFSFFAAGAPENGGEGILVKKDSGIKDIAGLAGRKVAVNQGGTGEYLLLKALSKAGVKPGAVHRVYLRPDQTAAAFAAGQVDAWATWSAYSVAALGAGTSKFLADGAAIGSENYTVWAVRDGFADKHPGVVKALYAYLHAQSTAAHDHPDEYVNVFTDAGPTAVTGGAKAVQLSLTRTGPPVEPIGAAQLAHFDHVAAFFAAQGITKKRADAAGHVIDVDKLR